jgi:hypothetical protein
VAEEHQLIAERSTLDEGWTRFRAAVEEKRQSEEAADRRREQAREDAKEICTSVAQEAEERLVWVEDRKRALDLREKIREAREEPLYKLQDTATERERKAKAKLLEVVWRDAATAQLALDLQPKRERPETQELQLEERLRVITEREAANTACFHELNERLRKLEEEAMGEHERKLTDETTRLREEWHRKAQSKEECVRQK